jgi:hypothetical protein
LRERMNWCYKKEKKSVNLKDTDCTSIRQTDFFALGIHSRAQMFLCRH